MAKDAQKKSISKQDLMPFSLLGDCASAFILLSRIPVFWFRFETDKTPNFTRSLWAFPLVGLVIGVGAGCLLLPPIRDFLPPVGASVLALGFIALATGALHEDGMADVADGFGGGQTEADKSRIMHDSHIGSYGVLALVVVSLFRVTLFFAVSTIISDGLLLVLFMAIALAAARAQIIYQLCFYPISPHAKLGAILGRPAAIVVFTGTTLWAIPLFYLFPIIPALGATCGALIMVLGIGYLARRQISGLSGDVMGASIIGAEIGFMTMFYGLSTISFTG
ncbi:adenosylcobinamide-GDP ribazoletransferase [Candidatus Puniceispirillum sp.]|uniref:adenosylcobinamide-GDP ribazoletransferase n=1 Tax=Candidatus Puniceispirillum sp. TaxID=2026719 RepID=UPI001EBC58E3|nr:adenosylcobinamide-GDP ribazoletransferase [Candidatus Puniceispirillum sp.]MBT6565734.1 adenosylcobinamide-GDP ribazoletransferase [Candidatus Puniceispirillum sp.]